jgi:hypothetical protein
MNAHNSYRFGSRNPSLDIKKKKVLNIKFYLKNLFVFAAKILFLKELFF